MAWRDFARPAGNKWDAKATFPACALHAAQSAGAASKPGTIVAGENNEGAFIKPELFYFVEHLANA